MHVKDILHQQTEYTVALTEDDVLYLISLTGADTGYPGYEIYTALKNAAQESGVSLDTIEGLADVYIVNRR